MLNNNRDSALSHPSQAPKGKKGTRDVPGFGQHRARVDVCVDEPSERFGGCDAVCVRGRGRPMACAQRAASRGAHQTPVGGRLTIGGRAGGRAGLPYVCHVRATSLGQRAYGSYGMSWTGLCSRCRSAGIPRLTCGFNFLSYMLYRPDRAPSNTKPNTLSSDSADPRVIGAALCAARQVQPSL